MSLRQPYVKRHDSGLGPEADDGQQEQQTG
jgi:hypothetical protein